MCYFITATVRGAGLDALNQALRDAGTGVSFADFSDSRVVGRLEPGDLYLRHDTGACDCDTWLGLETRAWGKDAAKRAVTEGRTAKLRAKGWSEARIRRWIQERESSADRAGLGPGQEVTAASHDAVPWVEVVRAALETARAKRFGLALHWYGGASLEDRFKLGRREFALADLTVKLLMSMEEDVLYSFRR
ncbi:MAG: hypothetical protein LBG60_02455 [Bifidobacteriaceae bacterium]|jgi:hypothetical protein|nr:hypothetical protein [Bifidobacteriaceae bacterium]